MAGHAEAYLVKARWKAEWWRTTGQQYRATKEENRIAHRNIRLLIGRHGQDEVVACLEWAFRHGKIQYWPTMSKFMRSDVISRCQAEMAVEVNGDGKPKSKALQAGLGALRYLAEKNRRNGNAGRDPGAGADSGGVIEAGGVDEEQAHR